MFKFNSNGVSLNLTRDVRHRIKTDDCPLKWCVTFQRKQVYYSTGINLNESDWNALIGTGKSAKIKECRDSLQNYYDSTIQKNVKLLAENGTFTFDNLNARLSNGSGTDLMTAFQLKIESNEKQDRIGNAISYRCAMNSFSVFSKGKLSYSDITVSWLNSYEKSMVDAGKSYATIGMYLRSLRSILNDAIEADIINEKNYPFGKKKYVIQTAAGRDLSLDPSVIKKIALFDCPTKKIEMYRDFWIFSFLANGMNMGDVLQLEYKNMIDGEISFIRAKTIRTANVKVETIFPILEPLQDIINKWGNAQPNKYIFAPLNDCKTALERKTAIQFFIHCINENIKKVTKALNLPDVSTYNCRHSYTTILAKKNVPESYIDKATSHTAKTVTQGYIGSYSKKDRMKYNSLLIWSKGRTRTIKKNMIWKA